MDITPTQSQATQAPLWATGTARAQGSAAQSLFSEHLAQTQSQTSATTEPKETESSTPKIARSWRMECANEATRVQEDSDFSFDDFLDLINPLQHIPVIGSLYREMTGDEIKPEIKIAGSVLFGAATGSLAVSAVAGIASAIYTETSGDEPTIQIAQALFGDDVTGEPDPRAGKVQLAAVDAAPQPTPAVAPAPLASTTPTNKPTQTIAASDGMRIGNVLYTSPSLKSAARVSASPNRQMTTEETPQAEATQTTTAPPVATTSARPADSTLGSLLQEQAKAKDAGQSLPPELVHDMMVMALEKYKTTQALDQK